MKKSIFLLLLLVCISTSAQKQKFNQLTINDGLSSGNVTCILQDSRGFMWFGTDNGLNRYDGYEVSVFRNNPQLPNSIGGNSVRSLFEDSKRNLWIGLKGNGLSKMDLKTGKVTTYKHGAEQGSLSYNDIAGVVEDKKGQIWIAVDRGGLDLYRPETDDFEHFPVFDSENKEELNNALTDIEIDKDGNLWLSSWGGGLYKFDVEKKNFIIQPQWKHFTESEVCTHIYSLFIDNSGTLWVASGHGGLYSLDIAKDKLTSYAGKNSTIYIPNKSITAVNQDNEERIWVSTTNEGIYIIEKDSATRLLTSQIEGNNKLLADNNYCIYTDKTGIVWIGTPVGVNYYSPILFQFSIHKKNVSSASHSENQVVSLLKDKQGNVWVGGVNSLSKISPDGTSRTLDLNPIRYSALHEDESGNIWIGGLSKTLLRYNPQSDSFTQIQIPSPKGTDFSYRNIYRIYEDWDRTLWLATELGVINYDPATNEFKPLFESSKIIYPEDKSHVVFRDKDLNLWVGTENGLKKFDRYNKYKTTYLISSHEKSITNNFITAINEDESGLLWIGTMGGLHRFDKNKEAFQLIKRPDKMYGDPVFGICKDTNNNLWISSTSEIIQFNVAANSFQSYITSDGLLSNGFQHGAYFQSADGELFFGGKDGFNSFYPEKLIKNTNPPKVVVNDFLIFNRSVTDDFAILENNISETKNIKIKYKQSVITFRFSALNYLSPKKNRYAYMLEGFDTGWTYVDADRRQATYTNLNPGEYTFKVKASNNDGVWNDTPTEIKLRITPPFWRTGIAYLFYFILLVSIIYSLIRHFTQRAIDKSNLRLAQLETERMKEIDEMKVNLFTNVSHEFRTPLSLIIGPITQIMEKKQYSAEDEEMYTLIYRNAQRLLRLINQLLDFRKIETGKLELNSRYENIGKFIQYVAATFTFMAKEKEIHYEVDVTSADFWMDFDSDKLDKILYNLISNAFHYTPEGGSVKVIARKMEENGKSMLQIIVSDSGIGISEEERVQLFAPFYQGKRQKKLRNGGSGIGLALTKGLIDLFQGTIHIDSQINEGTTFTVSIPVLDEAKEKTEIPVEHEDTYTQPVINEEDEETKSDQDNSDLILIVEDDPDMQLYVKNILSDKFRILTANNGREGFEKAVKTIPDLIISDIMMPVKDGTELAKDLKNDNKTSHIPVILLTSLHEESQVVKGYETGVDDYITKPFSASILKARIENILLLRKRSWEQYRQSENLEDYTGKLSDNPRKQEFLNKVNEIILSNIENSSFGINDLADQLNMSVNQLFRKVKNLLDTTPYNLIVQVRMTQAARLIRETDYNISEITFLVGYQELSNFSRSFKKFYNISPREYQTKHNNVEK